VVFSAFELLVLLWDCGREGIFVRLVEW